MNHTEQHEQRILNFVLGEPEAANSEEIRTKLASCEGCRGYSYELSALFPSVARGLGVSPEAVRRLEDQNLAELEALLIETDYHESLVPAADPVESIPSEFRHEEGRGRLRLLGLLRDLLSPLRQMVSSKPWSWAGAGLGIAAAAASLVVLLRPMTEGLHVGGDDAIAPSLHAAASVESYLDEALDAPGQAGLGFGGVPSATAFWNGYVAAVVTDAAKSQGIAWPPDSSRKGLEGRVAEAVHRLSHHYDIAGGQWPHGLESVVCEAASESADRRGECRLGAYAYRLLRDLDSPDADAKPLAILLRGKEVGQLLEMAERRIRAAEDPDGLAETIRRLRDALTSGGNETSLERDAWKKVLRAMVREG